MSTPHRPVAAARAPAGPAPAARPAGGAPGRPGSAAEPTEPRLVLVAHGSRDPRAERSTLALARAVARQRAARAPVSAAFLDFSAPTLPEVLLAAERGGEPGVVVVPLLLTAAYHGRVDVPARIEDARALGAGIGVGLAPVLGPAGGADDAAALGLMVSALVRRLVHAGGAAAAPAQRSAGCLAEVDGVLLVAAGSRDPDALHTVELVADALGAELGRPCHAGYASGTGRGVADAAAALRAAGVRHTAVASYFLAPGLLHDRAVGEARRAGAASVAATLGDAPEIVRLVLLRAGTAELAGSPQR